MPRAAREADARPPGAGEKPPAKTVPNDAGSKAMPTDIGDNQMPEPAGTGQEGSDEANADDLDSTANFSLVALAKQTDSTNELKCARSLSPPTPTRRPRLQAAIPVQPKSIASRSPATGPPSRATKSSSGWARAAWASSTRRGSSGSTAWSP